jgi:hypothetical protein
MQSANQVLWALTSETERERERERESFDKAPAI